MRATNPDAVIVNDASDEVFLETSQVAVLAPAAACATDAARPGLTAQLYSMLRCPNAA